MLHKQFTKVNVIAAQNELFIRNLFIVISSVTPLEKKKDIKLRKYYSQAKSHQLIYTFLSDMKQFVRV